MGDGMSPLFYVSRTKRGKGVTAVSTIPCHEKQSPVKTISVFAGKKMTIL